MADNRHLLEDGTAHQHETGVTHFDEGRSVKISPSDNVNDAGAIEQIITAESSTSLTITAVQSTLSLGANYLFEQNLYGLWNATGFPVTFDAAPAGSTVRTLAAMGVG